MMDWNSTEGTLKTKTRRYATTNELTIIIGEVPIRANIDPDGLLVDLDEENNAVGIR